MTTRQRQATEGATFSVANGTEVGSERAPHFSWDEWFRHANPQQRAEALRLAQQQGLLYPHQLPAISNGVKPSTKDSEASPVIVRLLAGKADGLSCLPSETLSFFDAELDDLQRQAVARAIATPDLFLLQGLPGTGKSRVLAEIVLQAAARGWRVLFLAGHVASLDVVLQRLLGRSEVFALRFLDTLEKPETLPAWLRGYTLDEQRPAFLERVLAGARGNHAQVEASCRDRQAEESLWAQLQSCIERCHALDTRIQTLADQFPRIRVEVERLADAPNAGLPFTMALAELRTAHDEAVREMEAKRQTERDALAKCEKETADLAAKIAQCEPAYRAKKNGQFWTLAYWTNLFNASVLQEMDTLVEQHARAQADRAEIVGRLDLWTEQQQRADEQYNQQRAVQLGSEIEAREQALKSQQAALDEETRLLDAEWNALCQQLEPCPAEKTPAAVATAHQAWLNKKNNDEQQCRFAQQWTEYVEEAGQAMAARLPSFANLLAGSILRWHTDAKFRDAVGGPLDLLIVEDAETLTEADLLKLSRHAQRTVLVGQSIAEPTPAPTVAEKASRALLAAPLVSAVCWNRLWQTLGGDAGHWPCTWEREEGRLVCQLLPLSAEDRQYLESEGLADAPDIELRILHRPRTQPGLAQVIFAPHCTFQEAFAFMVREVQEFPLEPLGRSGWWSEDAHRFSRHLGPNAVRIHAWLEIEPGLRLGAVPDDHGEPTRIACIEFDKGAGWDRAGADDWLHRHRPVHDQERTVFLQTPYRFEPALAKIVKAVVRANDWLTCGLPSPSELSKSFDFVAVPPLSKPEWPREGAGLELDLSASRHADRLPVGLRHGLPSRGYVNYLEAQALIRRLESWLQKEAVASHRVAVLALYEGQVELLRRLVEQSEILRSRTCTVEVALPSRLHQRECDVAFLSMTRSHPHRSVAFGEDVKELPLAFTRPRARLLVFGDPGALCKRTAWQGPLDHLDASSAQQELVRLSRLLAFLQQHTQPQLVNGKD